MTRRQLPTDSLERALLEAILEAPREDAPRLVYADRLTERGDPRGETIIVQCERERLEREGLTDTDAYRSLLVRERELLAAHLDGWTEAFGLPYVWHGAFGRGFFKRATILLDTLRLRWRLFAAHPLEVITIPGWGRDVVEGVSAGRLAWLARKPTAQRAERIRVDAFRGRIEFDASRLCDLLRGAPLDDPGGVWPEDALLPRSRLVAAVHGLTLKTPELVRRLRHEAPPDLRRLAIDLQEDLPRELARADVLRQLTSFQVFRPTVDPELVEALADLPSLEKLSVTVTLSGVMALARGSIAPQLRTLNLVADEDDDIPVRLLSEAPFHRVERLLLHGFAIDESLATSFPRLYDVNLTSCRIARGAKAALSRRWPNANVVPRAGEPE